MTPAAAWPHFADPVGPRGRLQELEAVFHAMADGVVVFDAQGGVVLVNEAEARICGFSSTADMMRDLPFFTTIYELFSEEDGSVIPVAQWPVSRVLRGETVTDVKIRARRTDTGQSWHLRFDGSPVPGPGGEVRLAVVITRDVTEQVEAERAARASELRYRTLFQAMDEGFCVIEMLRDDQGRPVDYRFLEVNEAFHRQTGLADPVGRTIRELVPDHDSWWFERYGEVARTGVPVRFESPAIAMARLYDVFACRVGPPELCHVAVLFTDITERRSIEERAAQAQRLEALGRFAGGIAHDFNNLLTAVLGYTELLERRLAGHPAREQVTRIREASRRGSELTRQILAFARPQSGRTRLVDLERLVLDADPILRRLIGSDVELVTLPAAGRGAIRVDPSQAEQVLFNLVVNARDAVPDGGRIAIEVGAEDVPESAAPPLRPGRWMRLAVSDDGSGMDAATLARCFEPFFTTKAPDKGSGLGLATVWSVAGNAGGFVRVESAVGEGTRVEVYFPRRDEPAEATDASSGAPDEVRGGDETVLVVEDEPTLRELARTTLEAYGYRVLVAGHGHEALAAVEAHDGPVHGVVTDVVMPLMNGRELARRLREIQPTLPILFVSGYSDQPVGDREAFLAKPYAPSALAARLRSLLDG